MPTKQPAEQSNGVTFELVWEAVTPELIEEAREFWVEENAIPENQSVDDRARQLMVIARDAGGKLIAVTTAVRTPIPRLLNNVFYYYRCFIASHRRQEGLMMEISHKCREHMHPRFLSGEDTEAKGFYYATESELLKNVLTQAVVVVGGIDHTFIGVDEKGRFISVGWFDGATLD